MSTRDDASTAQDEYEAHRLAELRSFRVMDARPEPALTRLVELAGSLLRCPIAFVSLLDDRRQRFLARVGLDVSETDRDQFFCQHLLRGGDFLLVPDAMQDPRFRDTPLVKAAPGIRFYLGVPLVARGGSVLGTLCVVDAQPREPSLEQIGILRQFADQVMELLELRREHLDGWERVKRAAAVEQFLQQVLRDGSGVHRAVADAFQRAAPSRAFLDSVNAIAWECDASSLQFLWVSEGCERLLGHPRVACLGPGFWQGQLHPDDRESTVARRREETAAGRDHLLEYRFADADGRWRWLRDIASLHRGPDGAVARLHGLSLDVTEEHARFAECRQQLEWVIGALDRADDALVLFDERGDVFRASRAFAALFRVDPHAIAGTSITSYLPELPGPWSSMPLGRPGADGHVLVLPCTRPDGTRFEGEVYHAGPGPALDERRLFAAVVRERAQRSALEHAVLNAQERALLEVGRNLHDDVGQLLAALALRIDNFRQTEADPPRRAALDRIADIAARAREALAAVTRELAPDGVRHIGLQATLRRLVDQSRETFAIECSFVTSLTEGEVVALEGERVQLYRIAQEAITNAVKHGRARRIRVELHRLAAGGELSVWNDGVSLPPVSARARRADDPGTGSGIPIMEGRARLIGATLRWEVDDGGVRLRCGFGGSRNREGDQSMP